MRVMVIVDNYGNVSAAIGRYADRLVMELKKIYVNDDISYETDTTTGLSKSDKVFSMRMYNCIRRVTKRIKEEPMDVIIIEYPFEEYNPLIIPAILRMKKAAEGRCRIVLSVHEYVRAQKLRKLTIQALVRTADTVFVTDNHTKELLQNFNKSIYIREIPSIVDVEWGRDEQKNIDKSRYVYFGNINKSKAFDKMLNAWKIFNLDNRYMLDIITGTEIELDGYDKFGVRLFKSLSDEDVSIRMKECAYCILPILDEIADGNTTFKTAAQAGCTVIGKFSSGYKKLPFIIDMCNYDEAEFVDRLRESQQLDENRLKDNACMAIQYSKKYSFNNVVRQIVDNI